MKGVSSTSLKLTLPLARVETRELMDNVQYAPARGRFKVYLIDEVHMFSKHSFNALLKTLEPPYAREVFVGHDRPATFANHSTVAVSAIPSTPTA